MKVRLKAHVAHRLANRVAATPLGASFLAPLSSGEEEGGQPTSGWRPIGDMLAEQGL